jgi:hypothetical protein
MMELRELQSADNITGGFLLEDYTLSIQYEVSGI